MRIGYDAKWYFEGPASGRIVVRRHLEALGVGEPGHTLVALLDRSHQGERLSEGADRLERAWMWAGNNLAANSLLMPAVVRRLRLDVLITHNFTPVRQLCPTVTFVHDVLFREFPQFYTRRERLYFLPLAPLARRSSRICTPSDFERRRIHASGIGRPGRVDVVPLGVDPTFRPREQHDPAELRDVARSFNLPDQFLLFVGRINARKNLEALLHALPLLPTDHPPLVVVGARDWKSSNLAPLCESLGVADRVRFVGSVDHDRLPLIYSLATAFVFPSWAESFGLPPLEAMSSGVPAVVSNATSIPEICGDAVRYCDPASPESIAVAITEVLSSQELRASLTAAGLVRAAMFSWARSAEALLESAERACQR